MNFIVNATINNDVQTIFSINSLFYVPEPEEAFRLTVCCTDCVTQQKSLRYYACSKTKDAWTAVSDSVNEILTDDWFQPALLSQLDTMTHKTSDDLSMSEYPVKRWERLKQEDDWAYQVLTSEEHRETVLKVTTELLKEIQSKPELYPDDCFSELCDAIYCKRDAYPAPVDFNHCGASSDKDYLIEYLTTQVTSSERDNHIKLLCILWKLPHALLEHQQPFLLAQLNNVYKQDIAFTREHSVKKTVKTNPDLFGNTQVNYQQKLFVNTSSHRHDAVEYQHYPSPQNPYVCQLIESGQPYVSGASGMTNSFSAIFPLLKIPMSSEQGKELQQIMTAFIVGAAQHSVIEVEHSFALSECCLGW
ncbi:hypothetical protein [Parashewanella tropica]|uniref:hypothetical protein n=1 Tax=Parashewanella tropica TaxID=2547970 RepID=UPI00105A525A|nr:hypothetical protein [Parashewanella tropica]